MRGNLSGRQDLNYGEGRAYDIEVGDDVPATNYQPRIVARVLRLGSIYQLRTFQVRTKHSVNMTPAMHRNLALMGGVGAIFAAIISDKESQLYNDCVRVCPKGVPLRAFISPILRQGLAAKSSTLVIAEDVAINNPWVSGGEGVTVNISTAVLDKFASELNL